jgi:hypothetical protein
VSLGFFTVRRTGDGDDRQRKKRRLVHRVALQLPGWLRLYAQLAAGAGRRAVAIRPEHFNADRQLIEEVIGLHLQVVGRQVS